MLRDIIEKTTYLQNLNGSELETVFSFSNSGCCSNIDINDRLLILEA
jgi:hypothetical protein